MIAVAVFAASCGDDDDDGAATEAPQDNATADCFEVNDPDLATTLALEQELSLGF